MIVSAASTTRWLLAAALLTATGCMGVIGDAGPTADGDEAPPKRFEEATCEADTTRLPPPTMRRLTIEEYGGALTELLGFEVDGHAALGRDDDVAGFAANTGGPISEAQFLGTFELAEELATRAVSERRDALVGCDPDAGSCLADFVARFGRRVYRRALEAEERTLLMTLYSETRAEADTDAALGAVIHALLVSPDFLYRAETVPRDAPVGPYRLPAPELATHMAFLLWGLPPDDALLDAVDAGQLDDASGIETLARRMLDDPRANGGLRTFARQWLLLRDDISRTDASQDDWSSDTSSMLLEEVERFFAHVVRDGDGRLATLLTSRETVGGEEIASYYGGSLNAGGTIALPEEHAGLLTRAGVLASHGTDELQSWILRGRLVREQFLCDVIGPPPSGVSDMTETDRLQTTPCVTCHERMDPIGMGFSRFDRSGRYRRGAAVDHPLAGFVVDAQAVDVPESFSTVRELASSLAESDRASDCIIRHWYRRTFARFETSGDACLLTDLERRFVSSGGNLRELLIDLMVSDAFRMREVRTGG